MDENENKNENDVKTVDAAPVEQPKPKKRGQQPKAAASGLDYNSTTPSELLKVALKQGFRMPRNEERLVKVAGLELVLENGGALRWVKVGDAKIGEVIPRETLLEAMHLRRSAAAVKAKRPKAKGGVRTHKDVRDDLIEIERERANLDKQRHLLDKRTAQLLAEYGRLKE